MNEINVKELAVKTREAMQADGVSEYSLWKQYINCVLPIAHWFKKRGHEMFSEGLVFEYLNELAGRFDRGEIKRSYYNFMRRGAERMLAVAGGNAPNYPEYKFQKHGSRYKFNSYYESLLLEFTGSENFHKNTLGDITWVTRKFFAWLYENGHENLENVGADEIQMFVIDCGNTMKVNSVHNVKLYLRKLCAFLYGRGLLLNSFENLLTFRVSREAKQLPTASPDEIEAVLNIIDRDTSKGKRDYAMFMLAIVTGLRGVDIARLKLTDIDWRKGEINIIQSKTGQNLQLPLTADIGEALRDYILNGRQKVKEPEVFLRHRPPYRGFADAVAIGDAYDEYLKAAGYERKAFDGKGFHSLRRAVGTSLVTSDISITDAAQLLGKIKPESMKKYIALDVPHLKECALDFADIHAEVMS
jgi:integrase